MQNRFARELLLSGIRALAIVLGALVAFRILDASGVITTVAGLAGLAGLALSFAFRDLAENSIASVLLSLRQPFFPDDHVVIEGHEGRVIRLTSRATILMDLAGNHVRIPNARVFKGVLVNYTRNPKRRYDFTLGVAPDTDLGEALILGTRTLQELPGVLQDPAAAGWIDGVGDSTVVLHFFAWVDQNEAEWAKARSEGLRVVMEAFGGAGISMPEPTVNVRHLEGGADTKHVPSRTTPALKLDISPDTHLIREIEEERAEAGDGGDLLDPHSPAE